MAGPLDVNAKLKYRHLLWAGLSGRAFGSVVALVGLSYEQFPVGCSYDANTSQLAGYNSGSHEILIGLRLLKKNQNTCISKFW